MLQKISSRTLSTFCVYYNDYNRMKVNYTNLDECNVVDKLAGCIKVLVDNSLGDFINFAIALQINVTSIHQILLS
jgi:hypothetical protein